MQIEVVKGVMPGETALISSLNEAGAVVAEVGSTPPSELLNLLVYLPESDDKADECRLIINRHRASGSSTPPPDQG